MASGQQGNGGCPGIGDGGQIWPACMWTLDCRFLDGGSARGTTLYIDNMILAKRGGVCWPVSM